MSRQVTVKSRTVASAVIVDLAATAIPHSRVLSEPSIDKPLNLIRIGEVPDHALRRIWAFDGSEARECVDDQELTGDPSGVAFHDLPRGVSLARLVRREAENGFGNESTGQGLRGHGSQVIWSGVSYPLFVYSPICH